MHRLRFENARDGSPTPIIDNTSIHSAYRPREEGEKLAARFLSDHPGTTDVVVFGLAFGYHVAPLLDKVERIVVYEPLPEMLEAARNLPHLASVFERCAVTIDLSSLPIGHTPVFTLLSYRRLLQGEYAAFENRLQGAAPALSIDYPNLRVMVDYPVYGGSHTTARYVENALRKLGCQVNGLDNAYADGVLQRILSLRDKQHSGKMAGRLTGLLSELFWEEFAAFRPHLVIFLAQAPASPGLLDAIRKQSDALTAMWFVEDHRRFGYWRDYAPRFDAFFGIQRQPLEREALRLGARRYGYLPMAADDSIHRRLDLTAAERQRYGCDVAFMGAGYPNRHALFSQLTGYDLKLWGTGWENNETLRPHLQDEGARVSPGDTVKIYNAARININLHSSVNAAYLEQNGDFVNPRTFEVMACGGFQLCDRRSLLPELFIEGEDIVCFDSLPDLREKIDHYLARPEERERIARNGQRKVLNHHTYAHRMRNLIEQMARSYPDWAGKLGAETRHHEDIIARIGDPELTRFVASRPPAERNDITALADAVKDHSGSLKNYEAILLALETFEKNE